MTAPELSQLLIIFEKRSEILGIRDIVRRSVIELGYERIQINRLFIPGKICCSNGYEVLGVFRKYYILIRKAESLDEPFSEFGKIFQRSSEECDLAFYRMAACET